MDREKQIQKYMEKLQITRAEAEQLFDDDNSNEVLPEVAEMEKKAKKMRAIRLLRRFFQNSATI